jgi:hypothetical protein
MARKAADAVRGLIADMKSVQQQLQELETQVDKRVDGAAADLDAQVRTRLDEQGAAMEERLAAGRRELDESLKRVEALVSGTGEDIAGLRQRLDDVEARVPGLLEQLEELREALGRTLQTELKGVLSSFDSSVAGILEQMKAELQTGISRIEGIEQMVRGREEAERALLAAGDEDEEEPSRFEEWEQEAKDLAEGEEEEPEGDEAPSSPVPDEEEEAEPQEAEAEEHPGEMSGDEEAVADDGLDSALYDEEAPTEDEKDEPPVM